MSARDGVTTRKVDMLAEEEKQGEKAAAAKEDDQRENLGAHRGPDPTESSIRAGLPDRYPEDTSINTDSLRNGEIRARSGVSFFRGKDGKGIAVQLGDKRYEVTGNAWAQALSNMAPSRAAVAGLSGVAESDFGGVRFFPGTERGGIAVQLGDSRRFELTRNEWAAVIAHFSPEGFNLRSEAAADDFVHGKG